MCCGQKRSELRNTPLQRVARSVPPRVSSNSPGLAARTQPRAPATMQTIPPQPPAHAPIRTGVPHAPSQDPVSDRSIRLRYLENSVIRVRGPVTGLCYEFSSSDRVRFVDARDAARLLSTRFFRRA